MYRKIPYSPMEREIIGEHPAPFGRPPLPTYNTPVSPRENFTALFDGKHPYWMPTSNEFRVSLLPVYADSLGRGIGRDIVDAFGIAWKYEPTSGGSITLSGHALMDDVNDWKKVVKIPELDGLDWESARKNLHIDQTYSFGVTLVNGFWFERLISFMDFMPAAMALIDEEQTDAIKELFEATTALGCRMVEKICENFPQINLIEVHDDWGSQMAPFFSEDVANELIVPYMKKFTDCVHAHGRHAMLHSCGHNEERVQCYIDAGFDYWAPQTMNDIGKIYDKYGDRIVLSVWPEEENLAEKSEVEQRAAARRFVDRFCQPGKPSVMGYTAMAMATPAFLDEVYVYSRAKYLAE